MTRALAFALTACFALSALPGDAVELFPIDNTKAFVRVNLVGYRTDAPKTAAICSLLPRTFTTFVVRRANYSVALGPLPAAPRGAYGPCVSTYRLDFSALRSPGEYTIDAGGLHSPIVRIAPNAYDGDADTLLAFLRIQRSGFNPFFNQDVHVHDGIVVDGPKAGKTVHVSGGWADAADELQYVATSATIVYHLLLAYREYPRAFGDSYDARGLPGANGVPDVLDEARHGLDWLLLMYPSNDTMYNQIGDDRDHRDFHLPTTDDSDYGFGKGGPRAVYPCTGKPQGLFAYKNESNGFASTAGKFAADFALGTQVYRTRDAAYAALLLRKAVAAYALGRAHPGVCQTAPATAPYYYQEKDYVDDMELAAAELYGATRQRKYLREALAYAAQQPVKPWMGRDTVEHYQWYPFWNAGHYAIWRYGDARDKELMDAYYREGLQRLADRAGNGFEIGYPFVWVSNDYAIAVATQAFLYRKMTGDARFARMGNAALDWLLGNNPWGTSFVIGMPKNGPFPRNPQNVISRKLGVQMTGGIVDGPVYATIYDSLKGIRLERPDAYAPFNTGFVVYHDDFWDYSTNEPVTDVSADLVYLMAALSSRGAAHLR